MIFRRDDDLFVFENYTNQNDCGLLGKTNRHFSDTKEYKYIKLKRLFYFYFSVNHQHIKVLTGEKYVLCKARKISMLISYLSSEKICNYVCWMLIYI